ncbi:hypothetical protein AtDm6_1761 [Acetobacter tropicalis]|uniref:Uncharacterized protein n=1 Tax=Acetobacter tropicalis TaxID=104102 RepID=A0A095B295_9PROT|nr:hypothetical protein AtDm6_1761 [Acetobacter tropicalis]
MLHMLLKKQIPSAPFSWFSRQLPGMCIRLLYLIYQNISALNTHPHLIYGIDQISKKTEV